jgi:hypothetical protein
LRGARYLQKRCRIFDSEENDAEDADIEDADTETWHDQSSFMSGGGVGLAGIGSP